MEPVENIIEFDRDLLDVEGILPITKGLDEIANLEVFPEIGLIQVTLQDEESDPYFVQMCGMVNHNEESIYDLSLIVTQCPECEKLPDTVFVNLYLTEIAGFEMGDVFDSKVDALMSIPADNKEAYVKTLEVDTRD